ncbi:transposase [Nonomuraea sp. NPDC049695]|uniref:transposase n=1 Tax=Nonomuraea sp. NPDC049695 TaxID=3154734 RepID=UPI00341E0359
MAVPGHRTGHGRQPFIPPSGLLRGASGSGARRAQWPPPHPAPRSDPETLDAARTEQTAPAWHDRHALRCGIEAAIHQAVTVTVTGLRRARYRGIKKVHLEHIVSAIAVNPYLEPTTPAKSLRKPGGKRATYRA